MATWDVFHSDRLEVERSLSTVAVRAALAKGTLHDDDLARPAGTNIPWARLADLPALSRPPASPSAEDGPTLIETETDEVPMGRADAPEPAAPPRKEKPKQPPPKAKPQQPQRVEQPPQPPRREQPPPPPRIEHPQPPPRAEQPQPPPRKETPQPPPEEQPQQLPRGGPFDLRDLVGSESEVAGGDDRSKVVREDAREPATVNSDELGEFDINLDPESRVVLPVQGPPSHHNQGWDANEVMEDEDVLPDPQEEDEDAAEFTLARGGPGKVEELDLAAMVDVAFQMVLFFMVTATTILYKTLEVPRTPPQDAPSSVSQGQKKTLDDLKDDFILVEIDPEGNIKIDHEAASPETLIARLRTARSSTGRTAMLMSADFSTPHRNAVIAYDAANEIGLKIAIAKPAGSAMAPAPPPPVAPKKQRG